MTLPPHYFQRGERYRCSRIDVAKTKSIVVTESSALKTALLTKEAAWDLRRSWTHFGRYFEDVSTDAMAEDEHGNLLPTKMILTAELQVRGEYISTP